MTKAHNGHPSEPLYFSERLQQKLKQIRSMPTVIVEAAAGCGKTTAVRGFLQALPQACGRIHWFTAVSEAPAASFQGLCRVLGEIDSRAGQRLTRLGPPNAATLGDACDALRSIDCREEAFLVLDNFQYLQGTLPQAFQEALMEHGGRMHLVLISQQLTIGMRSAAASRGVPLITAADLCLNAEDIRRYFALYDLNISSEAAAAVARHTQGWVIAVYLTLRAYRDTGFFADPPDILLLMERLAWDPLTEDQQAFLLRLSPFEAVTKRQACALLGAAALPEYALDTLRSPFIRHTRQGDRYELHAILREVLLTKRLAWGEAFERECLANAGDLCRAEGAADQALRLYDEAGDMERALELDLSLLIFENIGGEPFLSVAPRILRRCPEELQRRHPLSMLRLAWALLAAGDGAAFDDLMENLDRALEADRPEDGAWLRGEWLLLLCWRRAPDLQAMLDLVKRAEPLFRGRFSRVVLPSSPWCFGNLSQITAFHSAPGLADREAELLTEFLAVYSRLTNGHGIGADALFRAELAHYRGELNEAEILLYMAGCLAESGGQHIIQLGVALHMAEIAVERADMALWERTVAAMERAASSARQGRDVVSATVDMLRSVLFIELGHPKRIAPWLKEGGAAGRVLPSMFNSALFTRLNYLMHEGEYTKLAGMAEAGLQMLRKSDLLTKALLSLQAGVGHLWTGNTARAEALLRQAADIALPDGFIYLLAVYDSMLRGLAEKLIRAEYPERLARFLEVKARFYGGYSRLHADIAGETLPPGLTAREREVALAAASGLRNGEIAKKLDVSENTVRAHLRAIYQKMDIDRRARLADKLK